MSGFGAQVGLFSKRVQTGSRRHFVAIVGAVYESIVLGSALTGAPGQPVDTGNLRASWQQEIQDNRGSVMTNVVYAPQIENGISDRTGKRLTLRSQVGGFHSVKLTRANFQRIVEATAKEAYGNA